MSTKLFIVIIPQGTSRAKTLTFSVWRSLVAVCWEMNTCGHAVMMTCRKVNILQCQPKINKIEFLRFVISWQSQVALLSNHNIAH